MPPRIGTTIGSPELKLEEGGLERIDSLIAKLPREALALRLVAVLNALSALGKDAGKLSADYARFVTGEQRDRLAAALAKDDAIFLEPWQQLLILRRLLESAPRDGALALGTTEGEAVYFDLCRFASDALRPTDPFDEGEVADDPDAWVKVAANMGPRMWMMNPPDVGYSIARASIMFTEAPADDTDLRSRVDALDARFPGSMSDLSFTETTVMLQFLAVTSASLKPAALFANPAAIRINPTSWLKDTTLPKDGLERLFSRVGMDVSAKLPATSAPMSPLPFRDRPLMRFSDGTYAVIYPPFLLEKLTSDVFWWLKLPDETQRFAWQRDWGYIAEAYAIGVLRRIASSGKCEFAPRVSSAAGELDAMMWLGRRVALIEITSSSLREAETSSSDWQILRDGLRRTFVENVDGKKPSKEAVLQLVRDVRVVLEGGFKLEKPPKGVDRIHPVMIAAARYVRTPGVVNFLQAEFRKALPPEHAAVTADLAVLDFEDLETVEALITKRPALRIGATRGFLEVLRVWNSDRGPGPSWWQFVEAVWGRVGRNDEMGKAWDRWRQTVPGWFRKF